MNRHYLAAMMFLAAFMLTVLGLNGWKWFLVSGVLLSLIEWIYQLWES
ncbi:hypothetical protein [Xenorhabdus innexi]|uniref:Uncharacterized protein n=1 Tax=Xenorhabdus innexi TaxID=290109 RepID=A0A1N6MQ69_9GAMM|nr:hypothetical protein [Xenorhabdus innexi]SIP70960.1 exported hypothetical protein [Xenorhabdus innexi]